MKRLFLALTLFASTLFANTTSLLAYNPNPGDPVTVTYTYDTQTITAPAFFIQEKEDYMAFALYLAGNQVQYFAIPQVYKKKEIEIEERTASNPAPPIMQILDNQAQPVHVSYINHGLLVENKKATYHGITQSGDMQFMDECGDYFEVSPQDMVRFTAQ